MTHSPHTAGRAESPRGVRTNGFNKPCVRHLNLTKSLADIDEKKVRLNVMRELRRARKDAELAAQVVE